MKSDDLLLAAIRRTLVVLIALGINGAIAGLAVGIAGFLGTELPFLATWGAVTLAFVVWLFLAALTTE